MATAITTTNAMIKIINMINRVIQLDLSLSSFAGGVFVSLSASAIVGLPKLGMMTNWYDDNRYDDKLLEYPELKDVGVSFIAVDRSFSVVTINCVLVVLICDLVVVS